MLLSMGRLLALILAVCLALSAQTPAPNRPKIGVALSGGSAYGLAHIGVLKWLEEHRIPVDYIAGTSMGSLVGGLYATGHTPAEIEAFVENIDWNQALSPTAPFRQMSYRRKEDSREYPSTVEFGLKRGIQLPPGLSAGHGVGLIISRFTAPYGELSSFDTLPTPFRCVATDLRKGEEVVFDQGPLFDALRSSMSLPALFAPHKIRGMTLVDGGLLNNIPVDVVRKMGADIVIAVVLDKPPEESKSISILGVAGRSISIMISANERRSIGLADLIVMPDLKGLSTGDYLRWRELDQRGYQAATAKHTLLDKFALPPEDYQAYLAGRAAKRRPETIKPQIIEVDGMMAPKRRDALMAAVVTDPSRPVDRGDLENELTKITGMGRFDAATYSFIHRGEAEGLRLRLHEKEYGPPFLKVSFLLDASRQEGFRFGIGGRLTYLDFGGPASEWRSDLSIGQINRLSTEYYYRLGGGKWFLAPKLFLLEDSLPLYQGDQQVSDFTTRQTGGNLDAGYAFGRFQELRAGYNLSHVRLAISKGTNAFNPITGRYSDFHVRWAYEGQDSALVPRKGIRASVQGSWILDHPGVDHQYPLTELQLGYARPFNKLYSLLTQFSGGVTDGDLALSAQFSNGGVGRLDALGRGRLLGNRYYYGGAHVLRSLASDSLALFGRFYLFAAAEAGKAWYPGISALPRYSGSLGLMGETAFGVVYFGAGVGDQGDRRLFFRLGRVF
jgi:NTE family protein